MPWAIHWRLARPRLTLAALAAGAGALLRALWRWSARRSSPAICRSATDSGSMSESAKDTSTEARSRSRVGPGSDVVQVLHPGPPITDFARDMVVAALDFLGAADLSATSSASRLLLLLAGEVQRRPTLVVEVGPPSEVLAALRRRLVATPTMGFLFGTGDYDLEDNGVPGLLARHLPPGCNLIGAATHELQALVPGSAAKAAAQPAEASSSADAAARGPSTQLRHADEDGQIALMLGSFPDAVTQSFHITVPQCQEIAEASGDAAAFEVLRKFGFPTGEEWKTVVLLVCATSDINPERMLKAFQHGSERSAIIGGIAGEQILLHSRGKSRVESSGIVGLALKGNVPLTALVSRGCVPVSRSFRSRCAKVINQEIGQVEEKVLLIPELVAEDGSTVLPLAVALQAQKDSRRAGPLFSGVRLGADGGYLLDQLASASFERGGALRVPFEGALEAGPRVDCGLRLFQLDADACRADLRRMLTYVRQQCEEGNEQILGTAMFTCGGRSMRFFRENFVDMKQFQAVFPDLPLVGFWAGGEIGPQALAEAAPAEATRTGRASLQGFTAVFGIFRAPLPVSRTAHVALADEDIPIEVGRLLGRLAQEAKERGNAAFKDGDHADASVHYTRAASLAAVPTAQVPLREQATILSNRSMAHLKGGNSAAALGDAEAALALDGLCCKAHYRRAQALLRLGRRNEAVLALREAVQQLPEEEELAKFLVSTESSAKAPPC